MPAYQKPRISCQSSRRGLTPNSLIALNSTSSSSTRSRASSSRSGSVKRCLRMAERFETIYLPAARYALPAVDESTLRAMRANSADREEPPQYAQLLDYVRMGGCAWGLRKAGRDERSLRLRGDEPPDGEVVGPCLAFLDGFSKVSVIEIGPVFGNRSGRKSPGHLRP